ncbi:MAG: stage II sporulation protein M [Methanosphaera sp.]|uniref:stage II sporulation protein M n=1 Tax=Methanosphaera sp. TaxID=2666342 RepID=UPI0025CD9F6A|nr:stage II sporulation protein M [Methanosphaera sp.]MCI5867850.1 stage II sporulation protein M [Methanosphaera sp.]MDD6534860.1 stage II sporulation protein M [Methanosphaera sp.]MDY3955320.1 stage II sporulation protein M [Methanosphaera sp.]
MSENDDKTNNIIQLTENSEKIIQKAQNNQSKPRSIHNVNLYMLMCMTGLLVYLVFLGLQNTKYSDVMMMEMPLLVIFTLALTYLTQNGHKYTGYFAFIVFTVLFLELCRPIAIITLIVLTVQIGIQCIMKIYLNRDDFQVEFKPIRAGSKKQRIKDVFSRLKYHILLSALLLFIGCVFGYLFPDVFQSILVSPLDGMRQSANSITTMGLFINNSSVAVMMIAASICLSLPTVYLSFFNGLFIGFVGTQTPFATLIAFTLPHGIFELTAIVIAGAIAFRITQALFEVFNGVINSKVKFADELKVAYHMIADCIIPVIVMFILLIIAAFIEANLTISIGQLLLTPL